MTLRAARWEMLLAGFEPSFEFDPVAPIAVEELVERTRSLRRECALADFDALIVHSEQVGWYHTSNSFLRYLCDWIREGILIIPCDSDRPSTLLSFYGSGVLLPPPGEPTWVEDVRQVGGWGREVYARPGKPTAKACEAAAHVLAQELGLAGARFAVFGDATSQQYWTGIGSLLPKVALVDQTELILRRQHVRSPHEQALVRAAAQLIDIGVQAAQHVTRPGITDYEIYAAFTHAQLARGGETGDGYQIGVSQLGAHVGKPYGRVIRAGDIVSLYVSHVTYQGYDAQAARMILVGSIRPEIEEVITMCVEGVNRAMALAAPGVPFSELNAAAFSSFIERGHLTSADARTMPFNLEANPDGTARPFLREHVPDEDYERQGRLLEHLYPATRGPFGPSLGHSVSMAGMRGYSVISGNDELLQPGMTFVIHPQWYEPGRVGCNIGNCLLVTETGVENLNAHTALEPHRIEA
jgi:Xaa-Pro aminopeptidase